MVWLHISCPFIPFRSADDSVIVTTVSRLETLEIVVVLILKLLASFELFPLSVM